ncbi:MAG: hypothetical protein FWH57_11315 [Oscillospiraceae bacterium]|nr:hypothetical protein [Oscillospiraceae bacterium]
MKHKGVLWITRTAVLIALLITTQTLTASMSQFVTGPLVNMILVVSVMIGGFSTGATVGFVSHFFAKLLGIGPLWTLVPIVAAANVLFVLAWRLIANRNIVNKSVSRIIALVAAAICKFAFLYIGVVRIALPMLGLPEGANATISAAFSVNQLITALIGGALAFVILPVIEKAVKARHW